MIIEEALPFVEGKTIKKTMGYSLNISFEFDKGNYQTWDYSDEDAFQVILARCFISPARIDSPSSCRGLCGSVTKCLDL